MARNFEELRAKMTPEQRERSEELAARYLAEMAAPAPAQGENAPMQKLADTLHSGEPGCAKVIVDGELLKGENAPTKPQCGRCKVSAPTLAKGWSFNGGKDTWVHHDQAGMAFACFNPPENAPVNTVQGAEEWGGISTNGFVRYERDPNSGAGLWAVFVGDMPVHHFKPQDAKTGMYVRRLSAEIEKHSTTPRAQLAQMAEALEEWESFIEFYAKREMEAPANSQEAVRDVRERLVRFRKLTALYREGQPK